MSEQPTPPASPSPEELAVIRLIENNGPLQVPSSREQQICALRTYAARVSGEKDRRITYLETQNQAFERGHLQDRDTINRVNADRLSNANLLAASTRRETELRTALMNLLHPETIPGYRIDRPMAECGLVVMKGAIEAAETALRTTAPSPGGTKENQP